MLTINANAYSRYVVDLVICNVRKGDPNKHRCAWSTTITRYSNSNQLLSCGMNINNLLSNVIRDPLPLSWRVLATWVRTRVITSENGHLFSIRSEGKEIGTIVELVRATSSMAAWGQHFFQYRPTSDFTYARRVHIRAPEPLTNWQEWNTSIFSDVFNVSSTAS